MLLAQLNSQNALFRDEVIQLEQEQTRERQQYLRSIQELQEQIKFCEDRFKQEQRQREETAWKCQDLE